MLIARFLCCLLLGAFTATLSAKTLFWVSPEGSDEAPGTMEQPFATLTRAKAALKAYVEQGLPGDIEVRLRGGIHRLNRPLELSADELGDGSRAITFMAHAGERAVIAGSRVLSGEWQRVQDDLWVLSVPEARQGAWGFRSLFRDERSLNRAREPDEGFYTVAAVEDHRHRLKLHQTLPGEWAQLTGVEINSTAYWHFNRQPAAAITSDSVTGELPIGTDVSGHRISMQARSRVWLENALVFADTPEEWFLDSAAGRLYYRAARGEDPNRSTFTAPVLRELIVVRGEPGNIVRNIQFRDLVFAETDWEMPAEGRLGIQAGAWAVDFSRTYSPAAALRFIYTHEATVERCAFRDLGDGAIAFEVGTGYSSVRQTAFHRVGSNVIQVGRMPEYTGSDGHPLHRDFASTQTWLEEMKKLPDPEEIWDLRKKFVPEAPAQITIADNAFIDCGHIDYGCVGVSVTYAHHITVEHNFFRGLPYSAISVGWRWAPGLTNCHSNLIRRNRIETIMLQTGDGGGVYLVGEQPGTRILDNYIHDVGKNYWAHGVYPDACSDHMEIAGNHVTSVMDHHIFMNRNGPNQLVHDNNGETGVTAITGTAAYGAKWVDFAPERAPPDLSLYGPRFPFSRESE